MPFLAQCPHPCPPTALYPLDTIKTRLQAMIGGGGFKALIQAGGGRGLYAGAGGLVSVDAGGRRPAASRLRVRAQSMQDCPFRSEQQCCRRCRPCWHHLQPTSSFSLRNPNPILYHLPILSHAEACSRCCSNPLLPMGQARGSQAPFHPCHQPPTHPHLDRAHTHIRTHTHMHTRAHIQAGLWGNLAGVAPASAVFISVYEPIKRSVEASVREDQVRVV